MAILAQKACGVWALPKSVPYRGFLPTLPSRPNHILCWRASFAYPRGTSRRGALALHASASRAAQCKRFGAVRHAGSAAEKPSRRGLTLHPNPWRLQGPAISARMSRIFKDSLLESVGRPGQQARGPGLSRAGYTGAGVWYTPKTQDLCSCRAGRDIECHRSHKAKRSKRKTGSPPKWSPDNSFKNPAPAPLLRKSSLSWASHARS